MGGMGGNGVVVVSKMRKRESEEEKRISNLSIYLGSGRSGIWGRWEFRSGFFL
jgi:hypothetical protein